MQKPAAKVQAPVVKADNGCCKECKEHDKLSKAVDTTCLDDKVQKAMMAAKEPLQNPMLEDKDKANKCLSELVDTHTLGVKVAKAEIASERPIETPRDIC